MNVGRDVSAGPLHLFWRYILDSLSSPNTCLLRRKSSSKLFLTSKLGSSCTRMEFWRGTPYVTLNRCLKIGLPDLCTSEIVGVA